MALALHSKSVFTSSYADVTCATLRVLEILQALEACTQSLDEHDAQYIPTRVDNQQRGWTVEYIADPRRIEVTFRNIDDANLFATIMDLHRDFGPIEVSVHSDGFNRVLLHINGAPSNWP